MTARYAPFADANAVAVRRSVLVSQLVCRPSLQNEILTRYRAERWRRDPTFRGCLIGRRYLESQVFLARFRPEHQGERHARRRWCRRYIAVDGDVALFVRTQLKDRIIDRLHISC